MSYIGGPLPGQEKKEQEDDDLREMWKEKRIGRETLQSAKDIGSKLVDKSPQWLKSGGHLLADTVRDMSTLEGNEKYNPADLITFGTMKALQGVGVVTDTVIGKPVSFLGHNVLGLDKDVANLTGDVAETVLTPIAAAKSVKAIKGAATWADDFYALASGTGMGTGAHGASGHVLRDAADKVLRKELTTYAKNYIKTNPDAKPFEIIEAYRKGGGTTTIPGDELQLVAAGRHKVTGERLFSTKTKSARDRGRKLNIERRSVHPSTDTLKNLKKQSAIENKAWLAEQKKLGNTVAKGHQEIMVEHNVSITGAKHYWKRKGNIGNNADNLYVSRNPAVRRFKDDIENFVYPKVNRSGKKPIHVMNEKLPDGTYSPNIVVVDSLTDQAITTIPFGTKPNEFRKTLDAILNSN